MRETLRTHNVLASHTMGSVTRELRGHGALRVPYNSGSRSGSRVHVPGAAVVARSGPTCDTANKSSSDKISNRSKELRSKEMRSWDPAMQVNSDLRNR